MSVAVLTLLVTAFVGGLALLAQMARKSREAEVTVIVVILALSILIAALGGLTGLGLLLMAANGPAGGDRITFAAAGATAVFAGVAGGGLCVPPLSSEERR